MGKRRSDSDPDDYPRTRHACWAMPGAVALIVLMILAFAAPFAPATRDAAPNAIGLAKSGETARTALATVKP